MNFTCKPCNYSSCDKSNFNKHIKSYLHKQKSNAIVDIKVGTLGNARNLETTSKIPDDTDYKCQFCERIFSRSNSLSKHENICASKFIKMKELEMELKIAKNQLHTATNQIDELKKYIKSTENKNNITYNLSVKNYVQQNYSDAPALEGIQDYKKLTYECIDFGQTLVNKYNDDTIHKFLGDFIIQYYKKDDPSQQSIWNSDISRLTYIVKELVMSNKSIWNHDPKGTKVKNYIINPFLKHIREYIDDYWIKNVDMKENIRSMDTDYIITLQSNLQILHKIKKDITNDTIGNDIIKYIAPYFYMNRSNTVTPFIESDDEQ